MFSSVHSWNNQQIASVPVCGSDDENILLRSHSIHLGEDLVDDSICSSASITNGSSAALCDGVQFIEEENARRGRTSLQFIKRRV
jgi:hypothetical protein